MMRFLLVAILLILVYHALKIVLRSAVRAYHRDDGGSSSRIPGAEMVRDPNCRTYIVKDRALARRVNGSTSYFCSQACADEYARKVRP